MGRRRFAAEEEDANVVVESVEEPDKRLRLAERIALFGTTSWATAVYRQVCFDDDARRWRTGELEVLGEEERREEEMAARRGRFVWSFRRVVWVGPRNCVVLGWEDNPLETTQNEKGRVSSTWNLAVSDRMMRDCGARARGGGRHYPHGALSLQAFILFCTWVEQLSYSIIYHPSITLHMGRGEAVNIYPNLPSVVRLFYFSSVSVAALVVAALGHAAESISTSLEGIPKFVDRVLNVV